MFVCVLLVAKYGKWDYIMIDQVFVLYTQIVIACAYAGSSRIIDNWTKQLEDNISITLYMVLF